ncbi:MAG: response regulator [Candidatus Schekmanbacteria bacterium]|nr:response regulator [Candidatus Schekmanbacteria bacterium]
MNLPLVFRRHISTRFAGVVVVLVVAFVVAFGVLSVSAQRALMIEDLERSARLLTENLSELITEAMVSHSYDFISGAVERTVDGRDIVYGIVLDRSGRVVVHTRPDLIGTTLADPAAQAALAATETLIQPTREGQAEALEAAAPIHVVTGERYGVLRLGFSLRGVDAALRAATATVLLESALFLVLGSALAWVFARTVTGPVARLTADAVRIARGDLERPVQAAGVDEIGTLAATLDQMRVALGDKIADLEALSRDLELRVEARTHELSERTTELTTANARLRELDAIKSRFLANVSHELRTPLTLVLTPLESLLEGKLGLTPEETMAAHRTMRTNALRLYRLIDDLLDFARLEAGAMRVNLQEVDLVRFTRETVASVQSWAYRLGLQLESDLPEVPVLVHADPEKLEKILLNLLSNAIKFSPSAGRVEIELLPSNDAVTVAVSDQGPGISAAEQEVIFERFAQASSAEATSYKGTGIGLALARELAQLQGGDLAVRSEPGRGATFTLALPVGDAGTPGELAPPDRRKVIRPAPKGLSQAALHAADHDLMNDAATSVEVSERPPEPGARLEGTVLVVEDHPDMRRLIADLLRRELRVEVAADGEQGLERLRELWPDLDLVITDVMMPRKDGYELLRDLRQDPELAALPVMMLSAKADVGMRVEGLERGADEYLVKPFHPQELLCRTRNLVALRRAMLAMKDRSADLEREVREKLQELLREARLHRYLPAPLVDGLLAGKVPDLPASERRWVTVFFSDLTGFTPLTDRTEPERVSGLLNDYMTAMVETVEAWGGTLDKFIGDGLMVFFGAPGAMEPKEQARRAVGMALAMQDRMAELGKRWLAEGLDHDVKIRMGINQDCVTAGNFGSRDRMQYTVIGRGVNLAARLEAGCTPGRILVSFAVCAPTREEFPYGPLEERAFKGFSSPVRVCELDPAACRAETRMATR